MSMHNVNFAIRITHAPTGETARVDSTTARSMAQAKQQAQELIRARVWAAHNGLKRPHVEIAAYDLPDGVEYPHDLKEFKL